MKWLRAMLRGWLFPEVNDFNKEVAKAILAIRSATSKDISVINEVFRMQQERVAAEARGNFFMFPGKKQVAVKDALKLLFDYFGVELKLEKAEDGEFVPRIHLTKDWISSDCQKKEGRSHG